MVWQSIEGRERGKLKQSRSLGVKKAINARDLSEEQAQNREKWRLGIGQQNSIKTECI